MKYHLSYEYATRYLGKLLERCPLCLRHIRRLHTDCHCRVKLLKSPPPPLLPSLPLSLPPFLTRSLSPSSPLPLSRCHFLFLPPYPSLSLSLSTSLGARSSVRFVSFRFVSFRFASRSSLLRFGSCLFVSFRLFSLCYVSFRAVFCAVEWPLGCLSNNNSCPLKNRMGAREIHSSSSRPTQSTSSKPRESHPAQTPRKRL